MYGSLRNVLGRLPAFEAALVLLSITLFGASGAWADPISTPLFSAPRSIESGNCCTSSALSYWFTTSTTLTVDGLGAYSASFSTGNPQDVALYTAGGTELAESLVTSTDPSFDGYNWAPVPDVTIDPGTYIVSVFVDGNTMFWSGSAPQTPDGVTWLNDYLSGSATCAVYDVGPDNDGGVDPDGEYPNVFYGPNVEVTPEPSSLILLGSGLLGLAAVIWVHARKHSPPVL